MERDAQLHHPGLEVSVRERGDEGLADLLREFGSCSTGKL
jgi:hypothetical protein